MPGLSQIYGELARKYSQNYPHGLSGLADRINKLVETRKTREETIICLVIDHGIEVPEIKRLIDNGISHDEAICEFSQSLADEEGMRLR